MPRYFAFLRALNVGGHNVKMDQLRKIFESLSFKNVETFIASGNVIFETDHHSVPDIERTIEQKLNDTLGYEVATFLRTDENLAHLANYMPFNKKQMELAATYVVGLAKSELNQNQIDALMSFKTEIDDFHAQSTEVFWLCKTKQSESTFDPKKLERAISMPVTLRTIKTIRRLAAKYIS